MHVTEQNRHSPPTAPTKPRAKRNAACPGGNGCTRSARQIARPPSEDESERQKNDSENSIGSGADARRLTTSFWMQRLSDAAKTSANAPRPVFTCHQIAATVMNFTTPHPTMMVVRFDPSQTPPELMGAGVPRSPGNSSPRRGAWNCSRALSGIGAEASRKCCASACDGAPRGRKEGCGCGPGLASAPPAVRSSCASAWR
mmetsp:Transcript_41107/g.97383  ORF Transcript_41107/g.97383 Transcript_41107/m.97383 type:complete len:200 (-) Transcript_41107:33-632(-)